MQLTKIFCDRFLPKYGDRTVDQMVQAARSVKQNIAEGLSDGQTSLEVELKLLGIARGSNQELLEDYTDYIKHHSLHDWATTKPDRYNKLNTYCKSHNETTDYQPYFNQWTDEEMANTAITLCHMVDRMISNFITSRDKEFTTEGGIRERMTAARLDQRETQKEIIARLQAENTRLKVENARLQAEIHRLLNER